MFRRALTCAITLLGLTAGTLPLAAAPAVGVTQPVGSLVAEQPAPRTPHVLNGRVLSVAQVGDQMILGGTFSQARNDTSTTTLTRSRLLAFSRAAGQISTAFNPAPSGQVTTVIPAGDGQTVYVAGSFTSLGGVARSRVARVRVADGSVVTQFNAGSINGTVNDLRLVDGRLWIAGAFTHVGGRAQPALATVDATTGAFSPYMSLSITGTHNGGARSVKKIDVDSTGTRLVAVGNFRELQGERREQLFMLALGGGSAQPATFTTSFYEGACAGAFDTYIRDVDFAPDGTYFVVTTTGAYRGATSPCDVTVRWETEGGPGAQPSWTDYTGGDTTYGVEVTDGAVYTGGHARWQNNPFAGDRAGAGAVARPGIAALDPENGLPFSWNPTRTRGVGVFDFLSTQDGLWVASDTDRIGNFVYKGRIALLPSPGASYPAVRTPSLPATVYRAGGAGLSQVTATQAGFGTPTAAPGGDRPWGSLRGAFVLGDTLYTGWSDGTFTRQAFDGTGYGPSVAVDTSDELVPLTAWRDDLRNATSLFYDRGRIYFTLAGSDTLYYRYFTAESDVVGAARMVATTSVSGFPLSQARGAFLADDGVFWADTQGRLVRFDWNTGTTAGAPVPGTGSVVSGPAVDGVDWSGTTLFARSGAVDPDPDPEPDPVADFTVSCSELTCDFDASDSVDADSFAWEFGDGATGTGPQVQHTYDSDGTRTVTLTVTSGAASDTTTRQVTVAVTPPVEAALDYVGAATSAGNRTAHRTVIPGSVQPGDQLVAFLTVNTTNVTVGAPTGWTPVTERTGNAIQGRVWTRTATAADAGSAVTVSTSGYAKSVMTVAAYRADGGAVEVAGASGGENSSTTTTTTPEIAVTGQPAWLLSYVSEKSGSDPGWTLPGSVVTRAADAATGAGKISAVLGDSAGSVPAGTAGGLTATTATSVNRTVTFSVVLTVS